MSSPLQQRRLWLSISAHERANYYQQQHPNPCYPKPHRYWCGGDERGMVYSEFVHGLNLAGITLDRKALADIAVQDAGLFKELAAKAQAGAKQKPAAAKA